MRVDGKDRVTNGVQKVATGLTFGALAHEITKNEFAGNETVKLLISITLYNIFVEKI